MTGTLLADNTPFRLLGLAAEPGLNRDLSDSGLMVTAIFWTAFYRASSQFEKDERTDRLTDRQTECNPDGVQYREVLITS